MSRLGALWRRRRLFLAGIAGVVACVAIPLIDPLRALNVWHLVALAGLVLLALVWAVEQRRRQLNPRAGEWRRRLEEWA